MSVAGSAAATFYRDVVKKGRVWTLEDEVGYPAPMTASGKRSMPFWSSQSRVEKIAASVPAYAVFQPVDMPLDKFMNEMLLELKDDGLLVGLNWSGPRATGYDSEPDSVLAAINFQLNLAKEKI